MRYFGGKSKIAKDIANVINSYNSKEYYEPFCGSCWVTQYVDLRPAHVSDSCKPLITLFKSLQSGWLPPALLSEEEYAYIKNKMDLDDPLTAFAGFGCSFAGKWFGGYARYEDKNYCLAARNSLLRKIEKLKDVEFSNKDYRDLSPLNSVIYCDPPYANTTSYGAVGKFNSEEFFDKCMEWSRSGNIVLVSEYQAPADFIEIWSKQVDTSIRTKANGRESRIEKLYTIKV